MKKKTKHKSMPESMMRKMALVDWVKQAIFDAMKIWIDDHQDELSELIVESLSDRIEVTFLPKLKVKLSDEPELIESNSTDENHRA